ncbi:hypothetical protein D3C87_1773760 [compost metagenome]
MVRQHDAAGADADRLRSGCHMGDDDRGRSAGDALHAVVFGEPEALVAVFLGRLRQQPGVFQRLGDAAAFGDRGEIEDGERRHEQGLY